jgi:hypothetical protein
MSFLKTPIQEDVKFHGFGSLQTEKMMNPRVFYGLVWYIYKFNILWQHLEHKNTSTTTMQRHSTGSR